MNEKGYNPMYNWNKKLQKVEEERYKKQKEGYSLLKNMAEKTKEMVTYITAAKFTFSLIEIAKSTFEIEQNMMQLGVRMGKSREGGKLLYDQFANIQRTTGQSTENVSTMMNHLASSKFQGDMEIVGAHMLRFAHATGLSASESAQLAVNLSRVGGLGDRSLMQITAGMAKVQQRVGISASGMSALADSISASAHNMVAFGKTEQDIKQMTIRTTALVAALEKVGIAAHESTSLIENLTDPERIEENIALYSQLGISIQDALNGGDITEQLGAGLQDMAAKAAAMGPIAGAQYAKAFGISYKTLMKANQADIMGEMGKTAEDMVPEDPQKTMIELQKNVKTSLDYISETINRFEGFIRGFGPIIVTAITALIAFAPMIGKKIASLFSPKDNKALASAQTDLEKGVEDSLDMAGKKGGEKLKAQISKTMKGVAPIGEGSISGTIGEKQIQQLQQSQQIMAEIEQSVKTQNDELNTQEQIRVKQLNLLLEEMAANKDKDGAAYAAQQSAEKQLRKELNFIEERRAITDDYLHKQQNIYDVEGQIVRLSSDALRMELESAKSASVTALEQEKSLNRNIELRDQSIKQIEKEIERQMSQAEAYNNAFESTVVGTRQYAEMKQKMEEATLEAEKLENILKKEVQDRENEKNSLQAVLKNVQERQQYEALITNEYEKRIEKGMMDPASNGGLVNNLKKTISAIVSGARTGISSMTTKVKASMNTLVTDIKKKLQNFKEHPLKASISGLKGLGGAIGKLIGPMAILGIIMKLVQPILQNLQDVLQPLMKTFQGVFGKLFNTLITSLLPPLLNILKLIWPLLTGIAFIAGMLVKGIGYLVKGLGFLFPPLKEVGDGLIGAGEGLMELKDSNKEVQNSLGQAADDIKTSNLTNTKATEENTAAQSNNGPADYYATGTGFTPAVTNSGSSAQASLAAQKQNEEQKARDNNTSIMATASVVSTEVEKRIANASENMEVILNKILGWLNAPRTNLNNRSNETMDGFGGPINTPTPG
jgi:hypothetical protein